MENEKRKEGKSRNLITIRFLKEKRKKMWGEGKGGAVETFPRFESTSY